MNQMIPGFIMGFREGLEALLLIAIMIKYVSSTDHPHLRYKVVQGAVAGLIVSIILGMGLNTISAGLDAVSAMTKVWKSAASLIALTLVTMFIFRMIHHGSDREKHIASKVKKKFSASVLFLISLFIIAREGTEISIFSFAGKSTFSIVLLGILVSAFITVLIFHSLVKIDINLLFKITLGYLILQAGFLLGYALHEGSSALRGYEIISGENLIFSNAFDVSKTTFSHKNGFIGIFLHAIFGWYSKPDWLQFITQYLFTIMVFSFWYLEKSRCRYR
ncbi:MAG: hydrogenase [Deltaproteobacteria bacterium]|jgi:high-affinity iron transporter|nr:hydrogenase [Deltaproteobacteria bacterium]MBT4527801.1 hydrogenase [Deltaproteobacteria bacterium]